MLTRIEAVSNQGALLNLPLEDLDNGYLLEKAGGIDPVKATITSSSFAQLDGTQYESSRREDRNITLKITLEPDYTAGETVRSLRRRLYSFFMPKAAVDLRFYSTDMDPVWISGRVESCEADPFDPESVVDISIICNNPDFYDPTVEAMTGMSTAGTTRTLISYDGDIETGLIFTFRPDRAVTSFSVYLDAPDGSQSQLDFNATLQAGDVVTISTVPGSKYARLLRAGVTSSLLYGVTPQSTWLELKPGDNYLRVYATGAAFPYDIQYTRKFGGL